MAKFSEILGGIAKDLAQVQVSSDLSSMEVLSHYKSNALLKNLDIPRFRLSDINLKLKFAIAEGIIPEETDSSVNYVEAEWFNIMNKEVASQVFASLRNISAIELRSVQNEFVKILNLQTRPNLNIRSAFNGNMNLTLTNSVNYFMEAFKKLSEETRKKLSSTTAFKRIVSERVNSVFESKMSSLQNIATAKSASERDLEIIIEKSQLERIDNEQIHEISMNLTPDFIKFVQDEEI